MKHLHVCLPVLALSCALWAMPQNVQAADQAAMKKEAKITMQQAEKTALAKEPGNIQSKEIERENGKLIYSFDIGTSSGTHEVNVDAMSGDLIQDSVESSANEAKEAQQDRAQDQKANPKTNPRRP